MATPKQLASALTQVNLAIRDLADNGKTKHKSFTNAVMSYCPKDVKREHVEQVVNMTPLELVKLLQNVTEK